MELIDLRIFARVAELGSFTRAAEQMGLTKGRVSMAVRQLEAEVGAQLLQRTTRTVRMSADGEQFVDRCRELIADAEQLQAMFKPSINLRGRLRLDVSNAFARDLIIPRLPEFLAAHPLLEIGISTTDRRVRLIEEGFDCVLRVGHLGDVNLVARSLGVMTMLNLASPAYLRAHGAPTALADLERHRVVHYAAKLSTRGAAWEYQEGGITRAHAMRSAVVVNGTDAYVSACLAGLGMIQAPVHGIEHLIKAGRLVKVMPEFAAAPMPVSLLYVQRRQMPPRVLALANWISQIVPAWLEIA